MNRSDFQKLARVRLSDARVLLKARRKSLASFDTTPGRVRIRDWKSRPFKASSVTCF